MLALILYGSGNITVIFYSSIIFTVNSYSSDNITVIYYSRIRSTVNFYSILFITVISTVFD